MKSNWYVIRIVAGKEKKAMEQLEYEIRSRGFSDKVKQLIIPTEKVYHLRKGKKVVSERNSFPGYVLIETEHSVIGELIGIHKTSNYVVGFLGGDRPQSLRKDEVNRILNKMDENESDDAQTEEIFIIGETVNIIDGPFNNFSGIVKEINNEKQRLKLDVKIFGRSTPLELHFGQVQRVY